MSTLIRNLSAATLLCLFCLPSIGADTSTKKQTEVKSEKKYQDARTLDGKKPRACDFKISLS